MEMANNLSKPEDKIKVIDYIPEGYKLFEAITGKKYVAPERCCLFCKHCSDIMVDYTHGPYMTICELGKDHGEEPCCELFEEG